MTAAESAWRDHYDHPGSWDRSFEFLTLPEMFARTVARCPDATLSDFLGGRRSYAQVSAAVERFAAGVQALGVAKGDRVGLLLPNIPDYIVAYYGALRAGGVVVNMSPLYSIEELAAQVTDSGARIVVTCDVPMLLASARGLLERGIVDHVIVASLSSWLPPVKRWLFRTFKRDQRARVPENDPRIVTMAALLQDAPPLREVTLDPSDVALIQYTGGTTGSPKGAMLTHANLTANAQQVAAIDPHPNAADRIVGVLPFFHVFANTCVLNRTVFTGGMIAMLPRFDAAQTLATISRVKATSLPGVPTMYQALLDHPGMAKTDLSSLRICVSGGAPLSGELKKKFETATSAQVVEGYGMTESSGVIACNPYEGLNKAGAVGQPIPGTTIRLVDREDPSRLAPDGEPGEIVFSGPQMMKGYWHQSEADAEVFTPFGLRTGDVGTIDEFGVLRIVDRLKDMISVGGFKVFPSQIEAVLYRHEAVKEAVVIGIPDAYHGELPKAFVTLNMEAEIRSEELLAWLNPQLGKHERVVAVEVRDALPKTLVGKLSRKELVAEERAAANH